MESLVEKSAICEPFNLVWIHFIAKIIVMRKVNLVLVTIEFNTNAFFSFSWKQNEAEDSFKV